MSRPSHVIHTADKSRDVAWRGCVLANQLSPRFMWRPVEDTSYIRAEDAVLWAKQGCEARVPTVVYVTDEAQGSTVYLCIVVHAVTVHHRHEARLEKAPDDPRAIAITRNEQQQQSSRWRPQHSALHTPEYAQYLATCLAFISQPMLNGETPQALTPCEAQPALVIPEHACSLVRLPPRESSAAH
eukprot:scaffold3256_cov444-Prasinococcus_capsulatus_cf.AAC.10